MRDGSYHLDTSHLASTVRYARVIENLGIFALP